MLTVAGAAVLISAGLSHHCFPFQAFDPDTAAYLFQARLLAQGSLSASAPPEFEFSPSPHIIQADVVYFRLGPLPAWGLTTADWRVAYERYFRGRAAYLYEQWALRRLEPPVKAGAAPR